LAYIVFMTREVQPKTLQDAIRYFTDPDVCLNAAIQLRWHGNPVACPTCGSTDVHFIGTRRVWRCREPHQRQQFSVKVGTIMEDSPIGLDKWMVAIWLLANAKNGISSYELHRSIGITQKSAWFMLHRIRLAMQAGSFGKIGGEVEIDETYVGGKARFMHKNRRERTILGSGSVGKVAVMGLLERHGAKKTHSTVRAKVVLTTRKHKMQGEVRRNVESGSTVYTDALKSYTGLDGEFVHRVIDHAECYAKGNVHTNGLENFWSLLKRAIKGTYVSIEPFHLFRYLDEQVFRFNNRELTDAERFAQAAATIIGKRLTYKALTGHDLVESCPN
jgi:transposase-like protein